MASTPTTEELKASAQAKVEAAATVALHSLCQRNERMTTALSEIIMHLENADVLAAKRTAEDALNEL